MSEPSASSAAELRLVHHHPGRLRLRSDAFLDTQEAAAAARAALESLAGATRVTHDPETGSLLVEYTPGLVDPAEIVAAVARAAGGLHVSRRCPPESSDLGARVIDAFRALNAATYAATGCRLELRTLLPAAMLGTAAVSMAVRGDRILPRWDNLAFWSFSLFLQLHWDELERLRRVPTTSEAP